MASGELRALAREGERVDVFKLDAVAGPRRFFRHYAFVAADHGIAFRERRGDGRSTRAR